MSPFSLWGDDPLAGNALHNRSFGVIVTEGITANEPVTIGNFERQMFPLLDLPLPLS